MRTTNEIRLNVDTGEANKTIPQTHIIIPTLEDITHELNGAAVFAHLDMNHGYHQLEQSEHHHILNARRVMQLQKTKFWHEICG